MTDITLAPTGSPAVPSLGQLQRAWDDLDRMVGEAERAIARIEVCRRDLVAAKEELASAIDRLVAPQYQRLEEWMFCPECNAGPGEEHSMHCSLEHGPELEPER